MIMTLKVCVPLISPGHFLLTHLLLDLIKRSAPARIVIVASVAHTWTGLRLDDINSERSYDPMKAYGQSKLSNVLFARSLAKRLQGEMRWSYFQGMHQVRGEGEVKNNSGLMTDLEFTSHTKALMSGVLRLDD